jgi:hypothetical protein
LIFEDQQNDIYGEIRIGSVKKKTQDFFQGEIKHRGSVVSSINGNYMGFLDIDGVRYWDIREAQDTVWFPILNIGEGTLPSDSTRRVDSISLQSRPILEAQQAKEDMETL